MSSLKKWRKQRAVELLEKAKESEKASPLLVRQLAGRTKKWLLTEPLDDVFVSLLALWLHSPAFFDGEVIALIAKRLLACEREVGGPYGEDNIHDIEANAAIAQLFVLLGAPLPKVNLYVCQLATKRAAVSPLFEMLLLFPTSLNDSAQTTSPSPRKKDNKIAGAVTQELKKLRNPLRKTALATWKELENVHGYLEISTFTATFATSLRKQPELFSDELIRDLACANIFFWMFSIIYDDFIDEEGVPSRLPVANAMQRRSLDYYKRSLGEDLESIDHYFDLIDEANAWEVENCRFAVTGSSIEISALPRYGDKMVLARRALGHLIGPLLLARLLSSGKTQEMVYQGLSHYLVARQLCDDMYDWAEDFERGHVSYVVAHLLRGIKVKKGSYETKVVKEQMRRYFFQQGMREICRVIRTHAKEARNYCVESGLLTENAIFLEYINRIEQIVSESIQTQKDGRDFLVTYGSSKNKGTATAS